MKIFSSSDIRLLEECAVESGVTMSSLMEKAGAALSAFTKREWGVKGKNVVLICGKGNNGGDGFIAANRLLAAAAKVTVVLCQGYPQTDIARAAFDKLEKRIDVIEWDNNKFKVEELLESADFIFDCIFGFGFKGKIEGSLVRLIEYANSCKATKISADLPSGCECDTGNVNGVAFKAATTVTFTALKPANVLSPASTFCGRNVIAPVGIDKLIVENFPSSFSVIRESDVSDYMIPRPIQSNKGDFGRLLMICGSYGMVGALIMAAKAALRSGVGLLNIVVDSKIYPMVAPVIPEAIFTVMDFSNEEKSKESGEMLFGALQKASACLIGCGSGNGVEKYLSTVIKFSQCPVVLDADALNYIAENIDELANARGDLILTPHPGEMARLSKKTVFSVQNDRFKTAKDFASKYGVFTVLKGAGTLIATPDGDMKININGNPGMAKGGSGDVLAGLMAGLVAQGMASDKATAVAVYVHGKAGDMCAEKISKSSMLPTDLIEFIPKIFLALESK